MSFTSVSFPPKPVFTRHPENPIIVPGLYDWRRATVFNPGVLLDDDGRFYLYERAAGGLRPFICALGLLDSDDGVHFTHVSDKPVFTPEMAGSEYGSVQDPRVHKMDGRYYLTFAFRPFAWSSHPDRDWRPGIARDGLSGVPRAPITEMNMGSGNVQGGRPDNYTRSGIAVSDDRVHWEFLSWATPADMDDRDVILFPERINGRYAALRRPLHFVGPEYGVAGPSIWLSWSDDLLTWGRPRSGGESGIRLGGQSHRRLHSPIKTEHGWLVLYHGVQTEDKATKRVVYRVGAMLLDLDDPTKIIARPPEALMEPETYYERFGLYIPNVIFPTGNVLKDNLLYLYYGVCDTAIALATVPMDDLMAYLLASRPNP